MAERPRATASGGSRPASAGQQPPAARHSTARVATTQSARRTELPGWFWGALGCLTVLVVGLSVVFMIGQNGSAPPPAGAATRPPETAPATAAPAAPPAAQVADGQRAHAPAIQIEPMAAPANGQPAAHPAKPRPPRPVKVARSPAAAKPAAAKPAGDDGDDDSDDEPKAKPRAAAPAAASDDEAEEK